MFFMASRFYERVSAFMCVGGGVYMRACEHVNVVCVWARAIACARHILRLSVSF